MDHTTLPEVARIEALQVAEVARGINGSGARAHPELRTLFGIGQIAVWEDGALVGFEKRPWKVLQYRAGFDAEGRPVWANVPAVIVGSVSDPPVEGETYL
jgi:hypothetical protein